MGTTSTSSPVKRPRHRGNAEPDAKPVKPVIAECVGHHHGHDGDLVRDLYANGAPELPTDAQYAQGHERHE